MGPQHGIELVKNDPGLDCNRAPRDIQFDDLIEVFRTINNKRHAYRLTALRSTCAARQNGNALFRRDLDRGPGRIVASRYDNADRFKLIDRGVGRVSASREGIEQHFAVDVGT
jgi:hypothetical protein